MRLLLDYYMIVIIITILNHKVSSKVGWGKWSKYGECSRSCGGGVQHKFRKCLTAMSDLCKGESSKYRSCNTQECPVGTTDFRTAQCIDFNSKPLKGKLYEWLPYYGDKNKCALYCIAKNENFYHKLKDKVIDGTNCDPESFDVCVNGTCKSAGCDHVLGSLKKEDKCLRCGGGSQKCKTIQGVFDTQNLTSGFNEFLIVPPGAMSIDVQELSPSNNYLALRRNGETFIMNGNLQLGPSGSSMIEMVGTLLKYHHDTHIDGSSKRITARGPTNETLIFGMIYQEGGNPGILYEYSLLSDVMDKVSDVDKLHRDSFIIQPNRRFSWMHGKWTDCSEECGEGYQKRVVSCMDTVERKLVRDSFCESTQRPAQTQSCNKGRCKAYVQWRLGSWGPCSSSCDIGDQVQDIRCVSLESSDQETVVRDELCVSAYGSKPEYRRTCNEDVPCPSWQTSEWSKCSEKCGIGNQNRRVFCMSATSSQVLDASACGADERPPERQTCMERLCGDEGGPEVDSCINSLYGCCQDGFTAARGPNKEGCPSKRPDCERRQYGCCPDGVTPARGPNEEGCPSQIPDCQRRRYGCCPDGVTPARGSNEEGCPNRRPACERSLFGCCSDGVTPARGPNEDGCPSNRPECERMLYGCCSDGITPARGPNKQGCPSRRPDCERRQYGCCPDGITPARGPNEEGCPSRRPDCEDRLYGCCPDGVTSARGPNEEGCPNRRPACERSLFGCCSDGVTPARGPNEDGCPSNRPECERMLYGCCSDGITPARGPNKQGCPSRRPDCERRQYGCCPDGITPARGPNEDGCPSRRPDCEDRLYGCCPDGVTAARGPNDEGCPSRTFGCERSRYGCCSDGVTSAQGPNLEGCVGYPMSCYDTLYGCCPDGVTPVRGPSGEGCVGASLKCSNSIYGCCPDGRTAARGQNNQGCPSVVDDCFFSLHGCCSDGVTAAKGPNNEGCPDFRPECMTSLYGCCPDGVNTARGPMDEGCPGVIPDCFTSKYGCCPDGITTATDPNGRNCEGVRQRCFFSLYGCCPDGFTEQKDSSGTNCPGYRYRCQRSRYGCCQDGVTEKRDFDGRNCPEYRPRCESTRYGCCEDGISAKTDLEGRNCLEYRQRCLRSRYGCCPDRITEKGDPDGTNCPSYRPRCYNTRYGCCSDELTEKRDPEGRNCPGYRPSCYVSQYGCCPDRFTQKRDSNGTNCPSYRPGCYNTRYGCCSDSSIAKRDPEGRNCPGYRPRCLISQYGCCPDRFTEKRDSNGTNCPSYRPRCYNSRYGCCSDGLTEKRDPEGRNCPGYRPSCYLSQYGCCPDRFTEKRDSNGTNCPSYRPRCYNSRYGCCSDGLTEKRDPEGRNCPGYRPSCYLSQYGCCPDRFTEKRDSNGTNCPSYRPGCYNTRYGCCSGSSIPKRDSEGRNCPGYRPRCLISQYGCCPDRFTQKRDSNGTNCPSYRPRCYNSRYGCCSDGLTEKRDPEGRNCQGYRPSCYFSQYGCCPDRFTEKRDSNGTNCPSYRPRCYNTRYGCCSDGLTEKRDPVGRNCPGYRPRCYISQYGCCPDRITEKRDADGRNCPSYRRNCYNSQFGCCSDGVTLKRDVRGTNCPGYRPGCIDSLYGCCPDGVTEKMTPTGQLCPGYRPNCADSKFGCCAGSDIPKKDPLGRFCPGRKPLCSNSRYGCCADSVTSARGPNYEGCPGSPNLSINCRANPDPGPCLASFSSWYYDALSKECRQFTYGGCGGNTNNFESRDECVKACGRELAASTGVSGVCDFSYESGSCRDNAAVKWYFNSAKKACDRFWYMGCHSNDGNGNRFDTKKECLLTCDPQAVCRLNSERGNCTDYVVRWYHDSQPDTKGCRRFWYGGCNGNENNFETEEQCQQKCIQGDTADLCPDGSRPVNCPAQPCSVTSCPRYPNARCRDEYCGACTARFFDEYGREVTDKCNENTDVNSCGRYGCCPDGVTPARGENYQGCGIPEPKNARCQLDKSVGSCRDNFTVQWYYNRAKGSCVRFWYGGCGGNENRFTSERECLIACRSSGTTGEINCGADPDAGPCRAAIPRWYYDRASGTCQNFTYGGCDGNTNNFESRESCLYSCGRRRGTTGEIDCGADPDTGPCRAAIPRWYYDRASGTCQNFTYGGCDGNTNNFESRDSCLYSCGRRRGTTGGIDCRAEPDAGPCRAAIPRWYYDRPSGTCQKFTYGGCDGNTNNFESRESCLYSCGRRRGEVDCGADPDVGSCRAYIPRWYYDRASATCRNFTYGGCGGNTNNFETRDSCLYACGRRTGPITTYYKPGNCPTMPSNSSGICVEDCQSDVECSGSMKCCSNGCGHSCYNPVSDSPDRNYKPGSCPALAEGTVGICVEDCRADADCPGVQKCCSNGCGRTCQNPESTVYVSTGKCSMPSERGPCTDYKVLWFYDTKSGGCKRFWYGGCRGNENRFENQIECENNCTRPVEASGVCNLPAVTGPCRASHKRWYFDVNEGRCLQFVYGGCRGNANRFITRTECEQRCRGSTRPRLCSDYRYGCCPDGVTFARGPNYEGCPNACQATRYGCCEDGVTTAVGPNFEGCYDGSGDDDNFCEQSVYGCCSDGETPAQGPNKEGCISDRDKVFGSAAKCGLRNDRGRCSNYTIKWFYNSTESKCQRFWYGGCDGNDNRFDTEYECQQACRYLAPVPVCQQPKVVGRCEALIRRYHYNITTRRCEEFFYGGCDGNQNNFETREQCERTCPVEVSIPVCQQPKVVGPCRSSYLRYFYNQQTRTCEQFYYGGCQGNDNNFETAERCEQRCLSDTVIDIDETSDACLNPRKSGPCFARLQRWYFDRNTRTCKQFIYGGCQGNNNRFKSQSECRYRCSKYLDRIQNEANTRRPRNRENSPNNGRYRPKVGKLTDVCQLPPAKGPCRAQIRRWYYEPRTGECREFLYGGCDGNNNNFEDRKACEQRCGEDLVITEETMTPRPTEDEEICRMSYETGRCRAAIPRWYYDYTEGVCKQFTYGGCEGNKNNFESQSQCESYCSRERVCRTFVNPPIQCLAYIERWKYDPVMRDCTRFVYGGCGGNANNFGAQENCIRKCAPERLNRNRTEPRLTWRDVCAMRYDPGPCLASIPRWYHNSNTGQCEEFTYGGCVGNHNNFEDLESCQKYCGDSGRIVIDPEGSGDDNFTTTIESEFAYCHLPMDSGTGLAAIPAWYYDHPSGRCRQFVYGGNGGNNNRFESRDTCEASCSRDTVCRLEIKSGNCFPATERWHYDMRYSECRSFKYGGCLGNANNFDSYESCSRKCGYGQRPPVTTDVCRLPRSQGNGVGYEIFWYYDYNEQDCRRFVYTGEGGNGNRFTSEDECTRTCYNVIRPVVTPAPVYTTPRPTYTTEETNVIVEISISGSSLVRTGETISLTCSAKVEDNTISEEIMWFKDGMNLNEDGRDYLSIHQSFSNGNITSVLELRNARTSDMGVYLCRTSDLKNIGQFVSVMGVDPVTFPVVTVEYDLCDENSERGGCSDYKVMWFYDKNERRCRRFWYGGCDGNANRFETEQDCTETCIYRRRPVTPSPTPTPNINVIPTCRQSRFGCCPDGQTPAQDRYFSNCRDTSGTTDLIDGDYTSVMGRPGQDVVLDCSGYVPGSNTGSVTWFRSGFLVRADTKYQTLQNGSLLIRRIAAEDSGTYACQVTNGNVLPYTQRFRVQVEVPIGIFPTPGRIVVRPGENAFLHCQAYGTPKPRVTWSRYVNNAVISSGGRYFVFSNGTLIIYDIRQEDTDTYVCVASNGVSPPSQRIMKLSLRESLRAEIEPVETRLAEGSRLYLRCQVTGFPPPTVEWEKMGVPMYSSGRLTVAQEYLRISNVTLDDTGLYTCIASNDQEKVEDSISIQVLPREVVIASCEDTAGVVKCRQIQLANLCGYTIYSSKCCRTCKRDKLLG